MLCFFFFNDTSTTEIYTLSLHDALPICFFQGLKSYASCRTKSSNRCGSRSPNGSGLRVRVVVAIVLRIRSEEHTSELQSQSNLVCRLLLEKKKKTYS